MSGHSLTLDRPFSDFIRNIVYNNNRTFYYLNNLSMATTGYCVKCKAKRDMADAQEVEMKNGRKAMKGKCSVCGTGMYCILKKEEKVS